MHVMHRVIAFSSGICCQQVKFVSDVQTENLTLNLAFANIGLVMLNTQLLNTVIMRIHVVLQYTKEVTEVVSRKTKPLEVSVLYALCGVQPSVSHNLVKYKTAALLEFELHAPLKVGVTQR